MMRHRFIITLLFISQIVISNAQSLKDQALEEFKKENYPKAIELMEAASKGSPEDAEIYYYLGFFTHYNANDSRPLKGYDTTYSQKVLHWLDKALEINPDYGDAKYFYFSECGAAALKDYQNGQFEKVRSHYEKAYARGVIPDWADELGKNMLTNCDTNAILFTHGDFPLNLCLFVQLHENFRKDISVIPLAFLDRPSFVNIINKNISLKTLRGVKTGLTEEQILDMHPSKWDTLVVNLPVPPALLIKYSLPFNYTFNWRIDPDYFSNRMVSKIEGEKAHPRTYLSTTRAMLLNIIETNNWQRPVYFTNTFDSFFLAGLDQNLQNCGLVSRLLPMKTESTSWQTDPEALKKLIITGNLEKFRTLINSDQPRVSGIASLYYNTYYLLAAYYYTSGKKEKIPLLIDSYKKYLMIGYNPQREEQYLMALEQMKN